MTRRGSATTNSSAPADVQRFALQNIYRGVSLATFGFRKYVNGLLVSFVLFDDGDVILD